MGENTSKHSTFYMDDETMNMLKKLAEHEDRSMSNELKQLIRREYIHLFPLEIKYEILERVEGK